VTARAPARVYCFELAPRQSEYWRRRDKQLRELAAIGLSHTLIAAELRLGGNGEHQVRARLRELGITEAAEI